MDAIARYAVKQAGRNNSAKYADQIPLIRNRTEI
jgi:hypothetical protein